MRGKHGNWSSLKSKPDPAPLEPAFGSSCKPYALLTCKDVHPCLRCEANGCEDCGGTGIAELPWGSSITCGVCWKSGKDSYRWLQRDPEKDPKPEPEPTKMPEDDEPEAPLTRKQRRAAKYGTNSGKVACWHDPA